ncbi:Cyclin, N-terminal domain containing protein [Tritrichomonas foetus]|uniref:Cyclin, N-terminal domain containing protein n=1 Tax=Tritrichomonas foetus TaxID=1144522 RepID=A0A1J4JCQ6_9EUKA|nr:Cyclin, N-terminal domain containing protein [Tritrichomonas foetus]|eukprot:OHS96880.1 Cyclin, N-terminal domain containing protein [Tritrichomonas foetus]
MNTQVDQQANNFSNTSNCLNPDTKPENPFNQNHHSIQNNEGSSHFPNMMYRNRMQYSMIRSNVTPHHSEYSDPDMPNDDDEIVNPDISSSKNVINAQSMPSINGGCTFSHNISENNINDFDNDTDDDFDEIDDNYEEEDTDEYESLPEVDQRNLYKPQKLARYAETIFSIARDDISTLETSSERIHSIQSEISPELHEIAVKWIFQLHTTYKMSSDTLYEAITYLNTVLSKSEIQRSQLQLVAVTCIWMAMKVEERSMPKLSELAYLCREQYKEEDFVACERNLLTLLDFRLSYPTSKMFLRRLLDAVSAESQIIEAATFFCDLSLLPIEFIDFSPVVVAMASVCLGKVTLDRYCPTQRLLAYSHLSNADDVKKCAAMLLKKAEPVISDKNHILYKKFTQESLGNVILDMNLSPDLIGKI